MDDTNHLMANLITNIDLLSIKLQDKKDWECVTALEKIKKGLMELLEVPNEI